MAEPLSVAELAAITTWVHAVEHLRWRKGLWVLPEGAMVAECWMPYGPPGWALTSAASGAPGSEWCPQLSPGLVDLTAR